MDTNQPPSRKVPLESISSGVGPVSQKRSKDSKDKQEVATLSHARTRAEIARISESNFDLRVNRRMRRDYGRAVFIYLVAYSIFAAVVIVLSGWKIGGFELPQVVLAAIVGSTAVSAIGLVGIVVTGLFKTAAEKVKARHGD